MNNIQVKVLHESNTEPGAMMLFLAQLTQRGHKITDMASLLELYYAIVHNAPQPNTYKRIAALPHGTIKRFSPITIAIVGASRRFLAQARTHQVGMTYVSASLQYSDYSETSSIVVPYELLSKEEERRVYIKGCARAMNNYRWLIEQGVDKDTAGYAMPQGLRNVLIIQANHEAWDHFIRLRTCNRNTLETQYVALRIWEELLKTADGKELCECFGPDCNYGRCREGRFTCGNKLFNLTASTYLESTGCSIPRAIIDTKFPALKEV